MWEHTETMDRKISTHTSLAGRDITYGIELPGERISTHTSLAGRDSNGDIIHFVEDISTHTSLAGRDPLSFNSASYSPYFYSHVPRGT